MGWGERQVPPLRSPEFLSRLVALANFMRLSLMKAAHVDLSDVAKQEFGYAPLPMNKIWRAGFVSSLEGPWFGVKAHCRSLGFPRIPVEFYGVDELHAAFLTESRTRGPVMCSVAGIRGSLGMTRVGLPLSSRIASGMAEKQVPPLRSG